MKLSTKTNELIFELGALLNKEQQPYLMGEGIDLRRNLLLLYRCTSDSRKHELIVQIMAEGGYPWFAKLARKASRILEVDVKTDNLETNSEQDFLLSDDEFMDLLPANGHFH